MRKIFDFLFSDYFHFLEIKKLFGKDFILFTQSKIQKEMIKEFDLNLGQEKFLIQSFLRRKMVFNSKTPRILLYNLACIESSLSLNPRSSDFLPEDLCSEGRELVVKILSEKPFYLTHNSPQFLKENPSVAFNSIRTLPKSANHVAWFSMSISDTPKLMKQIIESDYILDGDSPDFLSLDVDVVLSSLEKDPSSVVHIPSSVLENEKVLRKLILLNLCSYADISRANLSFLEKYKEDSELITKCFDIMDFYCSEDELFKERFNRLIMDSIFLYPKIQKFNDISMYYIESKWNDYKNHHPEYMNVFDKICGELRHHDTYELVKKNDLLSNMRKILGPKYEELDIAMKSYFDIFHSRDSENLSLLEEPKNTISRLSALYISKAKENYKKNKMDYFYEVLEKYYSLRVDHPFIHKKATEFRQREEFKSLYYDRDEKVMQFLSDLEKKYHESIEKEEFDILVKNFISYNYRKLSYILPSPNHYDDYIRYKKVIKLVHRLNSHYISIHGMEVKKYKHLIDYNEEMQEYYYSGVTFSQSEIEQFEQFSKKEKIFDQIKRDISEYTYQIPMDIDTIPSHKISMFSKLVPFNDEYFYFNDHYYDNFTISKLSELLFSYSKNFDKESFLDDDSYKILYDLLVNKGLVQLLFFKDGISYRTLYNIGLSDFSIQLFIQLIMNMKNIVELSKTFHLDIQNLSHIFTLNEMLQYVDYQTIALLGTNVIKELSTSRQFTSNDTGKIISMANDFVPRMLSRNQSTVPYVSGSTLHYQYSTYDSQDMDYLLSGIHTFACFRLDGNDNDFFHYCALNKNGIVIKITDHFGNFIARASGFRYGNSVYFNQLRSKYDDCGDPSVGSFQGERKDIIEIFQKACEDIVSTSQNNSKDTDPIDFVFVTRSYILCDYPQKLSDRIAYEIGERPMDTVHKNWFQFVDNTPNLNESQGYRFFYMDYGDYSIICMASSKKDSIQPDDIKRYDVSEIYQRKRNSIVVTDTVNDELFTKMNRIKAARFQILKNTELSKSEFELVPVLENSIFLVGDNWYIICDNHQIVDSCVLESDSFALDEFYLVRSILHQFIDENKNFNLDNHVLEAIEDKIKVKIIKKGDTMYEKYF